MENEPGDIPVCPQQDIARDLFRKFYHFRIPLSGSIEFTRRCNLNCVHCYIPEESKNGRNGDKELSTAQWIKIIDQITDAGCLSLLITGGEPFLRNDFETIYTHAKNKGMLITLFTNGVLLNNRLIDLFKDLPPHTIEITLYAANAGTYERITRSKGVFDRLVQSIYQLRDHNLPLKLKTMLMTMNQHEFFDMIRFAEDLGVEFRFDPGLFPGFGGDRTPLGFRLPPHRAVEMEFADVRTRMKWIDFFKKKTTLSTNTDRMYNCGAGCVSFHIDTGGFLHPCLMTPHIRVDTKNRPFPECWREIVNKIEGLKSQNPDCDKCALKMYCAFCPAFFRLETGNENIRSQYLCDLGKIRYQHIQSCFNESKI